ncbi:MAG: response regulator transcription factor [Caldilineaceae bacterium]|nr:response regulator transcription factor [Caldilineaceae bacterium]
MSEQILLIDDDALLRRGLAFALERAGYQVITAATAEDGLAQIAAARPDLVLLDIGLPGMDGLDALRQMRRHADLPVIFVTARRRELEQVLGLELGADDYVTKPFDVEVLLARIKAVLRRYHAAEQPAHPGATVVVGDLLIDASAHTVQIADRPIELAPREFDLLHALAQQPGHVFAAEELLSRVWGDEFYGEPQVLYVHVRRLREKVEDDPSQPRRILTVRGVGYKLAVQEA